jgi:hypothetical protein
MSSDALTALIEALPLWELTKLHIHIDRRRTILLKKLPRLTLGSRVTYWSNKKDAMVEGTVTVARGPKYITIRNLDDGSHWKVPRSAIVDVRAP